MELNKIHNMDCLEGLKMLPAECCSLIIADPPYFEVKGDFDFIWKSYAEYLNWCNEWLKEAHRVLKTGGTLYYYQQNINTMIDSANIIRKYFQINTDIIWNFGTGRPQKKCYRKEHEFILFCSKGEVSTYNLDDVRVPYKADKPGGGRKHHPLGKSCGTVWEFARVQRNAKEFTGHPTQKKIELSDRMIKASTNEGEIIIIPFGGSGSECLSASNLKRNFIAFENDSKYAEMANKRVLS